MTGHTSESHQNRARHQDNRQGRGPDQGLIFDGSMRRGSFSLEADFPCAPGEVLGVLGPNGSGKSTLVAGISGLEPLTTGALRVAGQVWDAGRGRALAPGPRRVGLMTAAGYLFGYLSAGENVAFGLRSRGVTRHDAHARAMRELEQVGVADLAARRPHELSSGQAQRVPLALDPRVLLLDEPLSAIDQSGRDELRGVLTERRAHPDALTLLVTHDPIEALTLADRLMFLRHPDRPAPGGRVSFAQRIRRPRRRPEPVPGRQRRARDPRRERRCRRTCGNARGRAVRIRRARPEGSPRNTWALTVQQIEHTGASARVNLTGELEVVADVTIEAVTAMNLAPGWQVMATAKAVDVVNYG